ncbi:MAG: type II toxin-antitoxin system VapC family toxin [Gammaproteobacteria bacterium]|nr:type II toxin-antitoxin system VapC family toxin [Gammaproteobacteria bacterium]
MITAVDTNILIDVLFDDQTNRSHSVNLIRRAYNSGAIVVSSVVYAELASAIPDRRELDNALAFASITVSLIDSAAAFEAGRRWRQYRQSGGPRTRIIADFLIGAHALLKADRFITRDRGFFSTYFPELDTD